MLFRDQFLYKARAVRRIDVHLRFSGLVGSVQITAGKEGCLRESRRVFVVAFLAVPIGDKRISTHQQGINRSREGSRIDWKGSGVTRIPNAGRSD